MAHRFARSSAALLLALVAAAHPAAQEAANRAQVVRAQEGMVWAFMVPLAIITAICGFAYLCRAVIEHRRWPARHSSSPEGLRYSDPKSGLPGAHRSAGLQACRARTEAAMKGCATAIRKTL